MNRTVALSSIGIFLIGLALSLNVALAQQNASLTEPAVVSTCEVQPDGTGGNCPPAVDIYFSDLDLTGEALDTEVATTAAALAQRAQLAEAEGDLPLCIDLSQGILRTAGQSSDVVQQQAIEQLAVLTCCVTVNGADDGIYFGTTSLVPVAGSLNDGSVTQGSLSFSSPSAGFSGVQTGDLLVIESGGVQGYYLISSVAGDTDLELLADPSNEFSGFPSSEGELVYEVRRRQGEFAENTCTPGFSTAAIPIEPAPLASPQ